MDVIARAADSSVVANGSAVVANGGISSALISPDFVQQLASSLGPMLFPSLQQSFQGALDVGMQRVQTALGHEIATIREEAQQDRDAMNTRMDALEREMRSLRTQPQFPPPNASAAAASGRGGSAGHAGGGAYVTGGQRVEPRGERDRVFEEDAWAAGRAAAGLPPPARRNSFPAMPENQMQRGGRHRDQEEFIARKVFIRGFAEIDDQEGGIKQNECRTLVTTLLARVPREYLSWLLAPPGDMHAPRFVNRQITLNLNDGAPLDAAQLLAKAISDACSGLDGKPAIAWNGRKIWASRDRKLWEKVRNGNLFRARRELEKCLPGISTYTDWAAGLLYIRQNEEEKLIGSWSAESDWTWKSERLLALVGQEKHDDLVDAMAPR
jgi:hypothetical protein